jgi:hypothetical protein
MQKINSFKKSLKIKIEITKGRKFDFFIKDGEKPVFNFGKFRFANDTSEITKLGFEVI